MAATALEMSERRQYQELFLHELNWGAPDHKPVTFTGEDGVKHTAINVSSYKGLRVWVCPEKPGARIEAELDRVIGKTTTDRLVIFYDDQEQVWRWPARRLVGNSTSTRLTRHRHRDGMPDEPFERRINALRLPIEIELDVNSVLARVREAFDVEAQNESKRASALMARMFVALERSYPEGTESKTREHEISVTLARILFLMFGDDTEMWEPHAGPDAFRDFVYNKTAADGSTLGAQLNELFVSLDTPGTSRGAARLPYVNGGLFRERISIPDLDKEFRDALLDACAIDWSTVSPAIFGSMFQSVRDAQTRRELGEHYTSEENILKTLNPLFLDELRAEFEQARTRKDEKRALKKLWEKLGEIRYLDPACGCGNFIIVAYRELRDLELRIMERLQEISGDDQLAFDPTLALKVTLDHFYGIEIDEWPARIAETAMFLVNRQCDLKLKQRFGEAPQRLPIETSAKIVVHSSLTLDWSDLVPRSANVIIAGNPPFLGISSRSAEQTSELQRVWGARYHGTLDYVTGWYAKAMEYFAADDGVWAFVSTNSITQGEAVGPLFEPLLDNGWRIRFAHRTFRWTSEATGTAAVHCVIIGFGKDVTQPRLFDYPIPGGAPVELSNITNISPYLTDGPSVIVAPANKPLNPQMGEVAYGNKPTDGGHLVVEAGDYREVMADPIAAKYVRRYVGARELLHNIPRHCLWLLGASASDMKQSPVLKQRVAAARKFREESAAQSTRDAASTAHIFRQVAQPDAPYLCIPQHVSETRPYFLAQRFDETVISSNANFLTEDPEGFDFAIISSTMFLVWQKTVGGRLESRLRFNKLLTWNTFPLPNLDGERRKEITEAGLGIVAARGTQKDMALANMYKPGKLAKELLAAHERLDQVIDSVFGIKSPKPTELERQDALFASYVSIINRKSRR